MRNLVTPFWLWMSLYCLAAWGQSEFKPTKSLFEQTCQKSRSGALEAQVPPPQINTEVFIPTLTLQATQTRFSFRRLLESMQKLRREEKDWFSHDDRRSVYGTEKRLKTVYYRGKHFIVDGHHRALVSTYFGATTTPTLVLADLSDRSPKEFRATMEAQGWAYWKNHLGQEVDPVDLCEMEDDPNFQLARLLLRKVDAEFSEGRIKISKSSGAQVPLAVKLNGGMPFFEIHLADALKRHGVVFDDQRDEEDLKESELHRFHQLLTQEARANSSPLSKVLLLDRPTPVAELNLEEIISKHMQSNSCENALRSSSL